MMALDINRIRQKQKETEARDRGAFFKPQEGRNVIRIFTFEHKVTKADVTAGLYTKDKLNTVVTEIDRPVSRFFRSGSKPVHFLSKEDALYKEYETAKRKYGDKDQKVRQMGPSTHYVMNVIDVMDVKSGMKEFAAPRSVYNKILDTIGDPDFGESVLGIKGQDFIITYTEKNQGTEKYSVKIRPKDKCEVLPKSVLEGVIDFYSEAAYLNLADLPGSSPAPSKADDADDEEEEDEDEDDLDEDSDDEEDEEDESDDEDEDSDEDDDSEEEDESDDEDEDEESEDDLEDEDEDADDEDDDLEEEKPKKKAAPAKKAAPVATKKKKKK